MQARLLVQSNLNINAWKNHLEGYWDHELVQLIHFSFPLYFNRSSTLIHEQVNHKSDEKFCAYIELYIQEELKYGALLGPFDKHPILSGHCSPFMTRAKPKSDRHCVIIYLSWPLGALVNAGIDRTSCFNGIFSLEIPDGRWYY